MPRSLSVLLAEGSALDAELVEQELCRNGRAVEVERVDSRERMREALERRRFDSILCSYEVPGFGAVEALELANELAEDVPFVILSGTIGEEAIVAALKAGVRGVVLKSNLARLTPVIERELAAAATRERQRGAEEEVERLSEAGERSAIAAVSIDIGERKKTEEALRAATESLEAIVQASPVAIVAGDREGRLTYWNSAAERIYGWTAGEVIGRPPPYVPADELESLHAAWQRVFAGGAIRDLRQRRVRKDGSVFDASISIAPLHDAAGEIVGLMGLVADISERVAAEQKRRRAEAELKQNLELLRKAGEERRSLLGRLVRAQEEERLRISSDIHDDSVQVLTALALRLDLLHRRLEDPELREAVELIQQAMRGAIARLRRLIFELHPPALDRDGFAPALRLCLEQARVEHGLEYRLDAVLDPEPDSQTGAILYRIAQEALVNVVKHAAATAVEVRVATVDGGTLVWIADDGVGFDLDRLDETGRPGHLGLAGMRERAELVGGRFRIESSPGSGTTVEFFVPVEPETGTTR